MVLRFGWLYGPGTWYGKDGMIYNQFIDGDVTLSDGVTSFVHLDDAVETSIQAIHLIVVFIMLLMMSQLKDLILQNGIKINCKLIQNQYSTCATI